MDSDNAQFADSGSEGEPKLTAAWVESVIGDFQGLVFGSVPFVVFASPMRIPDVANEDGEVDIQVDVSSPNWSLGDTITQEQIAVLLFPSGKVIAGPQTIDMGTSRTFNRVDVEPDQTLVVASLKNIAVNVVYLAPDTGHEKGTTGPGKSMQELGREAAKGALTVAENVIKPAVAPVGISIVVVVALLFIALLVLYGPTPKILKGE